MDETRVLDEVGARKSSRIAGLEQKSMAEGKVMQKAKSGAKSGRTHKEKSGPAHPSSSSVSPAPRVHFDVKSIKQEIEEDLAKTASHGAFVPLDAVREVRSFKSPAKN